MYLYLVDGMSGNFRFFFKCHFPSLNLLLATVVGYKTSLASRGVVIIILIRHELIIVNVLVSEPEDNGLDKQSDGRTGPNPNEVRIRDDRCQDLAQRRGQRGHEQENGHDKGPHSLRTARVRQLICRHVAEAFRQGAKSDVGNLDPNAERRDSAVLGACGGLVTARVGLVDAPLNNGADDSGDPRQGESEGNTGNTAEVDFVFAQRRVENVAQEWDGDDDDQGVEVA